MNSDKKSKSPSPKSCRKTHRRSGSMYRLDDPRRDGSKIELKDDDKEIDMNEFLEFLNVSCKVNDLITKSSTCIPGGGGAGRASAGTSVGTIGASSGLVKKTETSAIRLYNNPSAATNAANAYTNTAIDIDKLSADVDFVKLAENRLVNELLGHKKPQESKDTVEAIDAAVSSSAATGGERTTPPSWRCNSVGTAGTIYTRQTHKLLETSPHRTRGLHPKLNEKLDYVINEGVLDSVLPFICPVPLPPTFNTRPKVKHHSKPVLPPDTAPETTTAAAGANVEDRPSANEANAKPKEQDKRKSPMSVYPSAPSEKKEPEVIIHVCDEMKGTSRDFTCPQSLLVGKMGYFADVTAGQNLDEMDISVHCDIQIFDWLMRWVKHSAAKEIAAIGAAASPLDNGPQLDPNNVVPILVSASFLQMEPLLVDCLSFCHSRLSEVVRSSTNLACLNEAIITRLSAMFTNVELEMVRDKKERLTPRIWTKLIESLCESEPEALRGHYFSCSGLFRCSKCGKCLTNTIKSYLSCLPSNSRLNRWGQLINMHVRDSHWDITHFISHLFKELKSWRKVYWKLWGHCHFLYCCLCEMHFPVYQMTWCRYHPDAPNFLGPVTEGRIAGPTGRYPCCGQQAFRYETLPGPNGCQYREHSVLVETDRERAILAIAQLVAEGHALIETAPDSMQEVIAGAKIEPHWVGMSLTPQRCRQGLLPSLHLDETNITYHRRGRHGAGACRTDSSTETDTSDTFEDSAHGRRGRPGATNCHDFSSSSDGCESEYSAIAKQANNSNNKVTKRRPIEATGRFWSGELSARSNQDHQREFEEKVMKQVIALVNRKTGSDQSLSNGMPLGGTYVRLEAEWKEQQKQRAVAAASASGSNSVHNSHTHLPPNAKGKNK